MDEGGATRKAAHSTCEDDQTDIERLRSDIAVQTKTIESLSKTVEVLGAARSQTFNALSHLQAELHNMAGHIAGQNLEERLEALRCEVSTELHYLRNLLLPSPVLSPCSPSPSCSRPHATELRNQAAINHMSQELYHSRRILWEQIGELREDVHSIRNQFNLHRQDILKTLTESFHKDKSIERMLDTCQAQESSIQKLLTRQEANQGRADVPRIQTNLQDIVISKGKAPKKTGHGMKNQRLLLPSSDSDEGLNTKQARTAEAKEPVNITARRK